MTTMSDLFLYTIKSAFVLALLYVPYTLLLRKEDFFRFNRATLISILVLALVLPLCNISVLSLDNQPVIHTAQRQMIEIGIPIMQIVGDDTVEPVQQHSISWFYVASVIYLLGMLTVFFIRFIQFAKMGMAIRGGSLWKHHEDGVTVYCHSDNVAPYSWLNNIVISEEDYMHNGREIILHEKGHIRCVHSLDIILLTFVQMLQWWNPLVYMLGMSLRDVHEFEADNYVLTQGIAIREYQTLLIRKAVGASSYTFANNFNHSLIKKRLTMMCKKKSNPWMRSKVLYAIPMVAIALSAFATPEVVEPVKDAVQGIVPASTASEHKVTNNFSIDQITEQENAVVALIDSVTVVKPELQLQGNLPDNAVILLDGKEITQAEFQKIDPNTIGNISVLRKSAATVVLGRDVDDLIDIKTKDYIESQETDAFNVCEKMPEFEGGMVQLLQFFQEGLRYPKIATECSAQGRVLVQFIVEKNGSVSNLKIVSNGFNPKNVRHVEGEDPNATVTSYKQKDGEQYLTEAEYNTAKKALEDEATRIVSLTSGKWTPGEQNGKPVRVKYTLPISFRLK